MICELSPYACMPNTMSIGAMSAVLGKHPDLLYAQLEIKGDAEVHALSRCQMTLTEEKKRAQQEYETALEALHWFAFLLVSAAVGGREENRLHVLAADFRHKAAGGGCEDRRYRRWVDNGQSDSCRGRRGSLAGLSARASTKFAAVRRVAGGGRQERAIALDCNPSAMIGARISQ
jgi:hypothetical protein